MFIKINNNYFIVFIIFALFKKSQTECQIDIGKDLTGKDPVFITKKGELWVPNGSSLFWKPSEKSIIACGERNNITTGTGTESEIECSREKDFKIKGIKTKISNVQCSTSVTGDNVVTTEKCSRNGTLHKIGFKTKTFGLVKYFDVCYDMKKASPIYTHHIIYGKAIDDASSGKLRPTFKLAGVPRHARPSESYRQDKQKLRLTELLNSKIEAEKYIQSDSFLARGHLTPDADGIFKSWQHATYFYVNVAPEWQTVNAGNWLRVENTARKVASKLNGNLEVYTGVFDILTIPGKNGKSIELSLEKDGIIPVPKWFWKIIKYKRSGIAFITLNNPFANKMETICNDVCAKYGFDNEAFNNLRHGYTYCCSIAELAKVIPDIPKSARVKKVLKL